MIDLPGKKLDYAIDLDMKRNAIWPAHCVIPLSALNQLLSSLRNRSANVPESLAGVVGTFGIGAMANFGVATEMTVITECADTGERTRSHAARATLSATQDCIQLIPEKSMGSPGTTVIAKIDSANPVNDNEATSYITESVRYLEIPVTANGSLISKSDFESSLPPPATDHPFESYDAILGPRVKGDLNLVVAKTGEVWLKLINLQIDGQPIGGIVLLRQGQHQIRTFRSRFALASAGVSSRYHFGGFANIQVLEPTAGREALTTPSLQLLQTIVTETEGFISEVIATTPAANMNTDFMEWAHAHGRHELFDQLVIRLEPHNRSITLGEVKARSGDTTLNYFDGTDPALVGFHLT